MKTLHKLKEQNKILNDFYVFDVETNSLRAKSDAFIFGVVYSHNYIQVIYSVDEFKKEFLKDRYKRKKVFAHNAEYDLSVIYDNIYNFDKQAIFNNRFIYATNGVAQFGDSFNILPGSVKKIGALLGKNKMILADKFKKGTAKSITKKDIEYCQRDCEIVYDALFNIFNEVGNIKITLAGLALEYFRRKYQLFHIDYNDIFGKYFYESYYGGRNEAFYIGKCNAVCYDINSMYPHSMINEQFPNPKHLRLKTHITVNDFLTFYLLHYEGCANITVKHKEIDYGFLPLKRNGKLLFPVGTFSGWYNFNEIRFALKHEAIIIKKVDRVIFSSPMKSPFIDYAKDLYKKKAETNNELMRYVYKLLLNSLYGKFAQRIKSEQIYIDNIDLQYKIIQEYQSKKQLIKIIPFSLERKDCFIEVKNNRGFLYHSIPLFSSYITSGSRVHLLAQILKYKEFVPLYCDTDSIFFKKNPKIKDSELIGEFKKEKKTVINIRGLKNYSYISQDKKINNAIKGIPKDAKKIGEIYKYKNLLKTREAMKRKMDSGILIDRQKILKLTYDKRIVLKNGETKPLKF
ncbi:MAG: DNA polymerase [Lutibacter sp.]|jgi:hypothetical protein